MDVREAMTSSLITISMDERLVDVQRVFKAADFHHLVVTEAGRVVGVLSDRDLLKNLSPFIGKMAERSQDLARLDRRVHQVMTRNPLTIGPDQPVQTAGELMLTHRISCLPVVNDRLRPLGIITIRDVARVAVDAMNLAQAEAAESRNDGDGDGVADAA